jgi:hypothetical protein
VKRLYVDPASKAFTTLVQFPKGWRRPPAGHYPVDEEVLFLEGSFEMSGELYVAGSYVVFPAGYLRDDSRSPGGALAIARFGGSDRWVLGPGGDTVAQPLAIRDWRTVPERQSPFAAGSEGRLLRTHEAGETWILEQSPEGIAPGQVELFSLSDHRWARVMPGERLPTAPGPVYCRLLDAAG